MNVRFADHMGWGKKKVVEKRSAEEIKKHIMDKVNGRVDTDASGD